MTRGQANWRPATVDDLEAVQKIGLLIHPNLSERPEVFAEKLRLFPEGCFVLEDDGVVGYAFVHPWLLNEIPKLDEFLLRLPPEPECLLIHDVAMLERARGRGAASRLLAHIARLAKERNLSHLALVSVYNSYPLWARLGFSLINSDGLKKSLSKYGEAARYMVRTLEK
jgi:N-acetylglutamate synthase-like GNAT family acetyltransferase